MCLISGLGRSPGGRHGNPLQYSCWDNPTDRGALWATAHRVAKSQTHWSNLALYAFLQITPFSCTHLIPQLCGSDGKIHVLTGLCSPTKGWILDTNSSSQNPSQDSFLNWNPKERNPFLSDGRSHSIKTQEPLRTMMILIHVQQTSHSERQEQRCEPWQHWFSCSQRSRRPNSTKDLHSLVVKHLLQPSSLPINFLLQMIV